MLHYYRTSARRASRSLQRAFATAIDPSSSTKLPYAGLLANLQNVKSSISRPLSLAEKILYSHIHAEGTLPPGGPIRGESYLQLAPDRVAMQDASAQMALLQFSTCGADTTAVPASIHCDHLISAYEGAEADVKVHLLL